MKIEGAVERFVSPTPEAFAGIVAQQRPAIILGTTDGWPAHRRWTLDYLRARIGHKQVRVKESTSYIHPDLLSDAPPRDVASTLAEYLTLLESPAPDKVKRYLSGDEIRILSNYHDEDPELSLLRSDFEVPAYVPAEQLKTIAFWLSARGLVSWLHYDADGSHNLNVQVRGKKRFLLFSPKQSLYPFSGVGPARGPSNFSQVNIDNPDEARFPSFRTARCLEAVVNEGEMLFIPSYWYHAVYHLGDVNLNVNFWWQPTDVPLNKTSFRATFLTLVNSTVTSGQSLPNRAAVKAAIDHLSAESRQLLQRMETLIGQNYRI